MTAPVEDDDLPPDHHPARLPLALLIVLFAGVVVFRVVWGIVAQRHWDAAMRETRDRRPVLQPEIILPVSAETTHWLDFERAAEKAVLSEPEWSALQNVDAGRAPTSSDSAALHHVLNVRTEVLRLLRASRESGSFKSFAVDRPAKMFKPEFRRIADLREFTDLLRYQIVRAHAEADDAEVIESLRDMLYIAKAAELTHSPAVLHLAGGLSAFAVYKIDDIALELRIGTAKGDAHPEELHALILDLLDDQYFRHQLSRTVDDGAAVTIDCLADEPRQGSIIEWWLTAPYRQTAAARLLRYDAGLSRALATADFATAVHQLPFPIPYQLTSELFQGDSFRRDFCCVNDARSWVNACFLSLSLRRLAAVELAIRWYRTHHHGSLPPTLGALVPNYLPSVPTDPFARAGTPIGYVPSAIQPFIYSVGKDGTDDLAAGRWKVTPALPQNVRVLESPDIIFYVGNVRALSLPTQSSNGSRQRSGKQESHRE